jgi:hypothetical protein
VRARRVRILISSLVLALGVSACGNKPAVRHNADAGNNATYVGAGPVSYQLQISRELNGFSTEDSEYLHGLPMGTAAPTPTQEWYGVFMWAWNQSKTAHYTAAPSSFDVVDTQGTIYHPYPINPLDNAFAWTRQLLLPNGTQPQPDSSAFFGPTGGGELLFKINTTAYANRPLTLQIRGAQNQVEATIPLDL